ncbi:MAG: sigma-54-dependent Fis family transcriptional regulator [Bacteroidales bacterium]|nr:sigma-54-dependent Fis family transcriptional regulator [Bacteroidales bacterium]
MKKGKILIVDDNKQILDSLNILLKPEFEQIEAISNPNLIPNKLQTNDYDIILLDMNFASGRTTGNEGIFWLHEILKTDPFAIIILITAYGDIELAVKSIKEGATDFITKPWDAEKLIITLKNAYHLRQSKLEINKLKAKQKDLTYEIDKHYQMFIGHSPVFREVISTLEKVAKTDANVLILGENGTGKELIAREIHRQSKRSKEIFISVDMASLSENLFESEMFGHIKGSFTDAKDDRVGRFEAASGGTLFLDEIGNLSMPLQSKLLTAIQNRQISKIGSNKHVNIDIRLISATNKPLNKMVKENSFREDLLYRINTVQIDIPALRKRKEDIHDLSNHFLNQYATKYNKPDLKINDLAYNKLLDYSWPGNIRELKHTIERAVILCDSDIIKEDDFLFKHALIDDNSPSSLKLGDVEKWTIETVIKKCRGNLSKTAKILDVSRTTLYSKIEKYDIHI